MITYPQIDPVIFRIGPLQPRWYGMMYLLGFLYTFRLLKKYARWIGFPSPEVADSVLATLVAGLIITARVVYVIFYNFSETFSSASPWYEPVAIWHGGLAFHGGLLGTILAGVYVAQKYKIRWQRLTDVLALATPVGLGLGRIANFINGELWGRVTDVPWAMVFPTGGPQPRHPSQLYESFLEGPVLFLILHLVWRRKPRVGMVSTVFLFSYATFRIAMEFFREPDAQVGFLFGGVTMGQLLSVTMYVGGGLLLWNTLTRSEDFDAPPLSGGSKGKKKA
jgi:phosphatidylglycerol:prolipoprotein diacylglycerol transferase